MRTVRSSSRLLGGGSASVHAGIHPTHPTGLAWTPPPGLGLDTLPPARPLNLPLGLGLETPLTPWPDPPPPPGPGPRHPPTSPPKPDPPHGQNDRHV